LKAAKEYADKMVVQSDWNETDENARGFIKNKPIQTVAETKTIKWDGDTTGKTVVNGDGGSIYVKVAEYLPPDVVLVGHYTGQTGSGELDPPSFGDNYWIANGVIAEVIGVSAPTIVQTDILNMRPYPVEFPEAGLYFSYLNQLNPTSGWHENYITDLSYNAETTTLDPALFPDTIATKEYVDSAIGSKTTEEWTFTLEDGSTVNKTLVIG
jgi:hypothetical protein